MYQQRLVIVLAASDVAVESTRLSPYLTFLLSSFSAKLVFIAGVPIEHSNRRTHATHKIEIFLSIVLIHFP
jgi:hypothetical protein